MLLNIIDGLQKIRSPVGDLFFKALNFFDTQEFFLLFVVLLWMAKGWKIGLRMFYILLVSSLVNHSLKEYFALPRPFQLNPTVGVIRVGGYGLPSGAAQTALLLSILFCYYVKHHWKWWVALVYTLLISFSRLYLGVHFLEDILAGWLVGLLLSFLYIYLSSRIDASLKRFTPFSLFLISQMVPSFFIIFSPSPLTIQLFSSAMGIGMGVFISYCYGFLLSPILRWRDLGMRLLLTLPTSLACVRLLFFLPIKDPLASLFWSFFSLGSWVGLGNLVICRVWENFQKKKRSR